MKKRINKNLAICATTLILGGFAVTTSQAAAFLQFDPTANEVSIGEMFEVDVRYNFYPGTQGDQDLAGFDLDVMFDTTMLDFNGYSLTDNLGIINGPDPLNPEAEDWSMSHDGFGTVHLAEFSYLDDLSFQTDNFILGTLSFTALEIGQSSLNLVINDLSDAFGDSIAPPVFSGPATVTAAAPVPEPATLILFGTGLTGLVGMRRMRKKNQ